MKNIIALMFYKWNEPAPAQHSRHHCIAAAIAASRNRHAVDVLGPVFALVVTRAMLAGVIR